MIRLYHGSNVSIKQIDLSRSKRGKDFGQGFYLNTNPEQAMAMAVRTTRLTNEGQPTLSCFEFDEAAANALGLRIKIFPETLSEGTTSNMNSSSNMIVVRKVLLLIV